MIIDHALVTPGNGEDVVDGLNAFDKQYFKQNPDCLYIRITYRK